MRVFIVHAHPEPQSFNTSMRHNAERELSAAGHDVVVSDLYAMNFDPVAKAADFSPRSNDEYLVYALEQRAGYKSGALAPDIMAEVEKLLACDLLILNFPIFWFSVPAIMKGWIDRVFLSGPLYGGLRFYDRGGMRGRRAWVTATLGGQPHMFGPDSIHGELTGMLQHLLRGSLAYVGFEVLQPFFGFHVPYLSEADRTGMMDDFVAAVRTIGTRQVLTYPSMDSFTETLYRKD